ncbi:MAG TPA: 3,4-dihydroxyphenylacetate 2,3-dioxygenase [Solirubrobacteraceae bacterium]|nr:3,4-dihydroxyphenylacetate 2,3-dioxygenase [Solirubrobacteraceae bacterium]
MDDRGAQLMAAVGRPPYDILRAAHAELRVRDLAASREFYVDHLGLIVAAETPDALYLRGWEERLHHSLVLREGPIAAAAHLAFRVRGEEDLASLAGRCEDAGLDHRWVLDEAGQGRGLRVTDAAGFPLEFFHAMEPAESQLRAFDRHRGAPVLRFDHFNLHVTDVEAVAAHWLARGFRCTEYIETDPAPGRLTGAWLTRKPTVHDVGLTLGRGPRLHHLGFWVAEPIGVLRACDQLAAAGLVSAIERGPGRHGVSNAFFVYLRDPDGHRIELYSCDYYTGDPDHPPLRWSLNDPRCRSFWGTRAPDEWYEESSLLLDLDGEPLELHDAPADERTEIMA